MDGSFDTLRDALDNRPRSPILDDVMLTLRTTRTCLGGCGEVRDVFENFMMQSVSIPQHDPTPGIKFNIGLEDCMDCDRNNVLRHRRSALAPPHCRRNRPGRVSRQHVPLSNQP